MKIRVLSAAAIGALGLAAVAAYAGGKVGDAKPFQYDPAKTFLVQSQWLDGIGCPTGASVATYPATSPTGTYTDPACTTGDSKDKSNEGLLLVKTGPTSNNASSGVEIKDVKGLTLTELGYDLRNGSHCGAGAPRFNIETTDGGFYFLGCSSPAPTSSSSGDGFSRLRWSPVMAYNPSNGYSLDNITGKTLKSLSIVFDEGTDQGTGEAIVDNIDVSGTLIGQGPGPSK